MSYHVIPRGWRWIELTDSDILEDGEGADILVRAQNYVQMEETVFTTPEELYFVSAILADKAQELEKRRNLRRWAGLWTGDSKP